MLFHLSDLENHLRKGFIEMSEIKPSGIQIIEIKTVVVYAQRPSSLETMAQQGGDVEFSLSASYAISIDSEQVLDNKYLARVNLELQFGEEKERFVSCSLVVIFSGITDISEIPESERAGLVAQEVYPYARNKACGLLSEIGFPTELPYYPPDFILEKSNI